jgi:hypothetical protein
MKTITEQFQLRVNTPSDINQHMEALKTYASECEHITEMGVRTVVSTWAFLEAKPKRLVSIDINSCPVDDAAAAASLAGIDFEFIKASTLDIEIEETDLLFIDTWHVYQQLKQEFKLHCDKARKYIILHDTTTFGERGESVVDRGLWPAVEEFLQEHPEWVVKHRYTHNNGLTVLQRI